MILADTSIWIDHFRNGHKSLQSWLAEGTVVHHIFITEELACGHLKNRTEIIRLLRTLPQISPISHAEYLYFIEENKLSAQGLGLVDIHLLGAAKVAGAKLATLDKALSRAAQILGISL